MLRLNSSGAAVYPKLPADVASSAQVNEPVQYSTASSLTRQAGALRYQFVQWWLFGQKRVEDQLLAGPEAFYDDYLFF